MAPQGADRPRRSWHFGASCALLVGAALSAGRCTDVACSPARAEALERAPVLVATASHEDMPVAARVEPAAVVLVVIDGARWQEIFRGVDPELARGGMPLDSGAELLPNLYALVREHGQLLGAPGTPTVMASGPNFVSLPGYDEIFTGRRDSGCGSNDCARTVARTIADEARDAAASDGDVAIFSSWEILERAATTEPARLVMSTGRHHANHLDVLARDPASESLLRHGDAADPYPGEADYRPDASTAALALRYLETQRPRFLFLALGEADEYAHRGDYASYLGALRHADRVLGEIDETLIRTGRRATTTILVTADHGRSRDFRSHGDPESARVWLAVFGAQVAAQPSSAARAHRLADIAPTIRALLCLPASEAEAAGLAIDEIFAKPARSDCL